MDGQHRVPGWFCDRQAYRHGDWRRNYKLYGCRSPGTDAEGRRSLLGATCHCGSHDWVEELGLGGSYPPHKGLHEEDQDYQVNNFFQEDQDHQASHSCQEHCFCSYWVYLLVFLFLLSLFVIVFQLSLLGTLFLLIWFFILLICWL